MDGEFVLKPGQKIKPNTNNDIVKDVIERLYGLKVVEINELVSYDNRNYYVKVDENVSINNCIKIYKDGYIVKITNSLETKHPQLLESNNSLLMHLKTYGINVPEPVVNINGESVFRQQFNGDANGIRLLTFLKGRTLNSVNYTPKLLTECGTLLAKMDAALKTFKSEVIEKRDTIWSLVNVPKVQSFIFAIDDLMRKKLVEDVINDFNVNVMTQIDRLPSGIIHGDFNEQNILVDSKDEGDVYSVAGVIDFDDVNYAPYIFNLAIHCAYVMLDSKQLDFLDAPAYSAFGYTSIQTLSDLELDILPVCIAGRLVQSLVMGAYTYHLDPGNEYLLSSSINGWNVLKSLREENQSGLVQRWKRIMRASQNASYVF